MPGGEPHGRTPGLDGGERGCVPECWPGDVCADGGVDLPDAGRGLGLLGHRVDLPDRCRHQYQPDGVCDDQYHGWGGLLLYESRERDVGLFV